MTDIWSWRAATVCSIAVQQRNAASTPVPKIPVPQPIQALARQMSAARLRTAVGTRLA
jgi:hypothetical protein